MPANLLIALGSNRRHGRWGRPAGVVAAAVRALTQAGIAVRAVSSVHDTAPVGPGSRRFANAVVRAASDLDAAEAIAALQRIERDFGRRGGKRWGDRVLDLDLLAHGGTVLRRRGVTLPHPRLHQRRFVLDPLVEVAPGWRHPLQHATARQLRARLLRPKRSRGGP